MLGLLYNMLGRAHAVGPTPAFPQKASTEIRHACLPSSLPCTYLPAVQALAQHVLGFQRGMEHEACRLDGAMAQVAAMASRLQYAQERVRYLQQLRSASAARAPPGWDVSLTGGAAGEHPGQAAWGASQHRHGPVPAWGHDAAGASHVPLRAEGPSGGTNEVATAAMEEVLKREVERLVHDRDVLLQRLAQVGLGCLPGGWQAGGQEGGRAGRKWGSSGPVEATMQKGGVRTSSSLQFKQF